MRTDTIPGSQAISEATTSTHVTNRPSASAVVSGRTTETLAITHAQVDSITSRRVAAANAQCRKSWRFQSGGSWV